MCIHAALSADGWLARVKSPARTPGMWENKSGRFHQTGARLSHTCWSSPASVYIICSCIYLSESRSAQRAFNQQLLNKYGAYEARWIIHALSPFSSRTARTLGLRWKQQVARTRVSGELLSFFFFFFFFQPALTGLPWRRNKRATQTK